MLVVPTNTERLLSLNQKKSIKCWRLIILVFVVPHVSALPGGVKQWKECLISNQKIGVLVSVLPGTT